MVHTRKSGLSYARPGDAIAHMEVRPKALQWPGILELIAIHYCNIMCRIWGVNGFKLHLF